MRTRRNADPFRSYFKTKLTWCAVIATVGALGVGHAMAVTDDENNTSGTNSNTASPSGANGSGGSAGESANAGAQTGYPGNPVTGAASASATAIGGSGAAGGGAATIDFASAMEPPAPNVTATATGGAAFETNVPGAVGNTGAPAVLASGQTVFGSATSGNVNVGLSLHGGNGGAGNGNSAGNGYSESLTNGVNGSAPGGTLTLNQYITGGNGGSVGRAGAYNGGDGGDATSILNLDVSGANSPANIQATASAGAGNGGNNGTAIDSGSQFLNEPGAGLAQINITNTGQVGASAEADEDGASGGQAL